MDIHGITNTQDLFENTVYYVDIGYKDNSMNNRMKNRMKFQDNSRMKFKDDKVQGQLNFFFVDIFGNEKENKKNNINTIINYDKNGKLQYTDWLGNDITDIKYIGTIPNIKKIRNVSELILNKAYYIDLQYSEKKVTKLVRCSEINNTYWIITFTYIKWTGNYSFTKKKYYYSPQTIIIKVDYSKNGDLIYNDVITYIGTVPSSKLPPELRNGGKKISRIKRTLGKKKQRIPKKRRTKKIRRIKNDCISSRNL